MNLYFRLVLVLIKSCFAARRGLLEGSRSRYRAWPFDCDINFHLTNARYFALCDLSRIWYMAQLGVLFKMFRKNWLPVVQAQEISYYKAIKPFQRFEVSSNFSYWDDKYWYVEHRFYAAEQLCAVIQVRGVFVHGKTIVPVGRLLSLVGEEVAIPIKPASVANWQELLGARKAARASGHARGRGTVA